MDYSKCTIVPYKNDAHKQNFMEHYREWKVSQFSSNWFDGNDIPVEIDVPSHSRPLHHFLTTQPLLRILFERLGREEKKNMAMVCKGWSKWFLIGNEPETMSTSDATTSSSTNNSFKTPRTRIETLNALQYIPFCPEEKKPKVGQVFETLESAELFYKEYCTICGFTPRLATTKRIKGNELPNSFALRNVVCNRQGGVKAYRGWKELCGGYDNIGATEVDFKNFVRDIKTYIGNFDAQMFVENLIGRKDTCSSFYFGFIVDENKCLAEVFWADPIYIKNYMLFGEVLSVDATYGTNKNDMVFVPFTGVDHHKRGITFGAGLIGDESIECYTWLFKTFLEAMGGCQPRIIITDQDKSMKSVVPKVFKESTHRLCMWHIMKKLREKVSYQLFQDEDFKTRLNREQWIPAYFKDVSMSGLIRVTSRSESENSFFDRFLTPHLTLVEFWVCYESALEAQRHKQSKLNSDNKHSEIPRKTKSNLEKIGLLCKHCLWILHNQDFQKIPEQYIMQRWTKAAMSKPVFDKDGKSIDVSQKFSTGKV
ncbi:protein FAR1-RELATED SEQUENCE 5-like [Silene latifolia]|uniref:protein FAR1-RELATED SEQUENCE 5-like n=1 Tax=Silene latifolia TaxID=37657 RepID=UPI003D787E4A